MHLPRLSLLPTSLLLLSLLPSALAQIGASPSNVSSNSSRMSYVGTWRSNFLGDVYQAYSNDSSASVTFEFEGVRASYVAIKKSDRGLSLVQVDLDSAYTVDLYDDSGTVQSERIVWTSPVLPYGKHNVTVAQIGPDARFGCVPAFPALPTRVGADSPRAQILPLPLHRDLDRIRPRRPQYVLPSLPTPPTNLAPQTPTSQPK